MSIINIVLQSVGLMRSPMPKELEKKLSGRNNVSKSVKHVKAVRN